ncbi:MAG: hypothetical protein ACK55I_14975 [bacterium]
MRVGVDHRHAGATRRRLPAAGRRDRVTATHRGQTGKQGQHRARHCSPLHGRHTGPGACGPAGPGASGAGRARRAGLILAHRSARGYRAIAWTRTVRA